MAIFLSRTINFIAFFMLFLAMFFIAPSQSAEDLRIAVTTSTYNSGLLHFLDDYFTNEHKIKLRILPVGTGKALHLGCSGDVDLVIVHAKQSELEFLEQGCGIDRAEFMFNYFYLVGPKIASQTISQQQSVISALKYIKKNQLKFISRGDDSGTHKLEKRLWQKAGIEINTYSAKDWYIQNGLGMGETLMMANQLDAITLTDSGTFYAFEHKIDLIKLYESDELLKNIYSVIIVNPKLFPKTNFASAKIFHNWLLKNETKQLIADFKVNGKKLFTPITK